MAYRIPADVQAERNKMAQENLHWCGKCRSFQSGSLFIDHPHQQGGTQWGKGSVCLDCRRKYYKGRRNELSQRFKARNEALKREWTAQLGGKCQRCGYSEFLPGLHFHHVDPDDKEYNPAGLIYRNDADLTSAELDKCILLCANCHNALTANLWEGTFVKQKFGWTLLDACDAIRNTDMSYTVIRRSGMFYECTWHGTTSGLHLDPGAAINEVWQLENDK